MESRSRLRGRGKTIHGGTIFIRVCVCVCERERKSERVVCGVVPVGVVRQSGEMCVGCGSGKSICGVVYGGGGGGVGVCVCGMIEFSAQRPNALFLGPQGTLCVS